MVEFHHNRFSLTSQERKRLVESLRDYGFHLQGRYIIPDVKGDKDDLFVPAYLYPAELVLANPHDIRMRKHHEKLRQLYNRVVE